MKSEQLEVHNEFQIKCFCMKDMQLTLQQKAPFTCKTIIAINNIAITCLWIIRPHAVICLPSLPYSLFLLHLQTSLLPSHPTDFCPHYFEIYCKNKAKQNNSKVTHGKAIHRANSITCLM